MFDLHTWRFFFAVAENAAFLFSAVSHVNPDQVTEQRTSEPAAVAEDAAAQATDQPAATAADTGAEGQSAPASAAASTLKGSNWPRGGVNRRILKT